MITLSYLRVFVALLVANVLCAASLKIEDFDSYTDTASLQANVFTFGTGAQAGKPDLVIGAGSAGGNVACFKLTWSHGNNGNLQFDNLASDEQDLSAYSEIKVIMKIETGSGFSAHADPTVVKLAIKGNNGAIWQTKAQNPVELALGAYDESKFNLSTDDMERVAGNASFEDTIADIENIRLRFENSQQANVLENAFIDSIVALSDPASQPSTGTIIQLGLIRFQTF